MPAKKPAAKKKAAAKKKVAAKKVSKKKAEKPAAKKSAAKKVPAKKPAAKKAVKKKASAKKPAAKKAVEKKTPAKKPAAKKAAAKKTPVKKTAPKKAAEKKASAKKSGTEKSTVTVLPTPDIEYPAAENPEPVKVPTKTVVGHTEVEPYNAEPEEEYMSDEQLEHFRQILIDWRAQLMQEVDSTVGHMKADPNAHADPLDRAAQEEGFSLELRTRDRERKLIKKIEQSIDMIKNGDYGFCETCGADIGVRRLEARPTAIKCIDCKTFEEIRERQGSK